jgi:hypothetical protein
MNMVAGVLQEVLSPEESFPLRCACATTSLMDERAQVAATGMCTRPDAIISAACFTAGALLAADSGWPSQKPRTLRGLKMTSSGLIDIGPRLIAA